MEGEAALCYIQRCCDAGLCRKKLKAIRTKAKKVRLKSDGQVSLFSLSIYLNCSFSRWSVVFVRRNCPVVLCNKVFFVGKGGLVALPLDEAADQAARQKKGVIFGGKKKLYNECKNDLRMFSPAIFTFSCVPETALVGSLELDGTKKHPAAAGRSAMERFYTTLDDTQRYKESGAGSGLRQEKTEIVV